MVRYYGCYSNVCRGRRKNENLDASMPSIFEPDEDPKAWRKNWARLIQRIYEADPLVCPKGQGKCESSAPLRTQRSSKRY